MTEIFLRMDDGLPVPDGGKNSRAVLWRGRRRDCLCLESIVDERLLEIRRRHEHWAFITGFADDLQAALGCGGRPSMWWTSTIYERHPRISPNLYPMYKLACLEMLMEELGARSITVYGGSKKLRELVRQLAMARGAVCRFEPGPREREHPKSLAARIYALVPAPLRALGRFVWWLCTVKRHFLSRPAMPPAPEGRRAAAVVTYFPNVDMEAAAGGRFRSRYWNELHDILTEQARAEGAQFVRWLFIYFPAPGMNWEKCVQLRNAFRARGTGPEADGLSFHFLEEFVTIGDICAALFSWLKLIRASWKQEKWFASQCRFEDSHFNFWPLLRWEWGESTRGWRCLERRLFNRAFRRYCRMAGPVRWNLYALENCPWERMLSEAARAVASNGPVFGAQHSTIRPTDFRYFDDPGTFSAPVCAAFQPDIAAANGASACAQWRANGMPEERLRQVEALRYLYLAKRKTGDRATKGQRLLIATSFFREETEAHLELVLQCLKAGILDNWQIVLKPHPYLLPDEWLAKLEPELAERIEVSELAISDELVPGTAVWASNSTTVALEAAMAGLAVMVMAADNDFDLCPIQDIAGLIRTATPEDAAEGLARLAPLRLPDDYLDLNLALTGWRKLLGITAQQGNYLS